MLECNKVLPACRQWMDVADVNAIAWYSGFVMWFPPVQIYTVCHDGQGAETNCTLKSVLRYK